MRLRSFTPKRLAWRARNALDTWRGLDFLAVLEPEEVGLDPSTAFRSSPSGNKYLRNVLRDFKVSAKDSIIDIGCGKGSAMRTMLTFPFARVDGIELSETIAAIARRNFTTLKAERATVYAGDASLFASYDVYNFLYFYNPFPAVIMSRVMGSIINSVRAHDRECCIIYNNPTCHDLVVAGGVFTKMAVYPDEWGNGIAVYANRVDFAARLPATRRVPSAFGPCARG